VFARTGRDIGRNRLRLGGSFGWSSFFCFFEFFKFSGFSLLKQSLLDFEGKTYDVVMVKDPDTNKEFELFFDISSQWQYGFKDIE
ncbi:MAG: hypothetical protein P8M49_03100, partial [Thalassotalea sp.]|nr:hypothetical protein [Thalassotalea sp.]